MILLIVKNDDLGEGIAYLFERYSQTLLKYTFDLLGSKEDAEDCVADAFVSLSNLLQTSPEKIDCWESNRTRNLLITIAKNKAYSLLRRRKSINFVALQDTFADDDSDLAIFITADDARDALNQALIKLDEKYRAPLILRYYHDLSVSEIARVLNASENNVSTWIRRAKSALKKGLVDYAE